MMNGFMKNDSPIFATSLTVTEENTFILKYVQGKKEEKI
jgi:hypothetical protein